MIVKISAAVIAAILVISMLIAGGVSYLAGGLWLMVGLVRGAPDKLRKEAW